MAADDPTDEVTDVKYTFWMDSTVLDRHATGEDAGRWTAASETGRREVVGCAAQGQDVRFGRPPGCPATATRAYLTWSRLENDMTRMLAVCGLLAFSGTMSAGRTW